MKSIVPAGWSGLVAMAIAAGALSTVFYYGHPVYLIAFALIGLVAGVYIVFMARLFGVKSGAKIVLLCWAITIAAMSAAEACVRLASASQEKASAGLLPTVVDKFQRWRTSDVAKPWLDADYGAHIRDPDTLRDMTQVMGDQFCRAWQFNVLLNYDNMFMVSAPLKLRNISDVRLSEQLLRNAKDGWLLKQNVAEYELASWKKTTQAGQDVLSRSPDPGRSALVQKFLEAQNAMMAIYQARNDQSIPQFQLAQAMTEELLKVRVAGDVTASDQALWDSMMKRNLDYGARQGNHRLPDPDAILSQYNGRLRQLFGMRPDDPRVIPLQNQNCAGPPHMPRDFNAITPQVLIDSADHINDPTRT